ncbi:MAG: glycosyltransferase [Rhodospirillales bacterium]|nr:glycosyltransferase [Rhodospirillales bacterium]
METPSLTFILCTRNGAARITPTLRSIAAAARETPETACDLVVVDNGSRDATTAVVAAWAAQAALPVTLLHEPRPGLAAARNAALAVASGTILAFTDDDCRLDRAYAARLLAHYRDDDAPVIRGGRIELGDPQDLPYTIKTDPEPKVYDGSSHPGGFIHGCNMAMHREVVGRIGPFDPEFGAGARFKAAEDTEYIYRAHRAGLRVTYDPDCVVHHHHGRRRREEILKLARTYAEGNGALYAKYLRDRKLLRHLYWDLKGCVRELCGGAPMDRSLGLTFRDNVAGCLRGMARGMARYAARARPGR